MSELIFLRSKAYAYLVENKDVKKLKGITKANIQKVLHLMITKSFIKTIY